MKKILILLALLGLFCNCIADELSNSTVESKYATITGNVKNRSGRGVRNVSIAIKGERNFSAKTNQQGDFVLKNIPFGDYDFTAKHREYELYKDAFSITNTTYSTTIVLDPLIRNGRITGSIKDEAGKPIVHASVSISPGGNSTKSDESGIYIIKDIPEGRYDVVCDMAEYKTYTKKNVTVNSNEATVVSFKLLKSASKTDDRTIKENKEEIVSASKTSSTGKDEKEESRTHTETIAREPSGSAEESTKPGVKDYSEAPEWEKERTKDKSTEHSEAPILLETFSSGGSSSRPIPKSSGLRAGYSDDNKQFNYYLHFLERFKNKARYIPIHVENRFIISCLDAKGKSIPNLEIRIFNKDNQLIEIGKTMANGTFLYFPDVNIREFFIEANYQGNRKTIHYTLNKSRKIEIQFEQAEKKILQPVPLDILFIMDTTGSMGEEIHRLKQMIELIALNIETFSPKPELRLGMVLYKDREDVYVTQTVPFTSKISEFQKELSKVEASGGGDYPEDLNSALFDALNVVEWNENGIRLAFIVTDAPPHLDYHQDYTYENAIKEAKEDAVKLYSVGTGGLDVNGEYVLRQISQYTSAAYVFLTYGETGESAGGKPGSVSHHTGENFQTDKLESIIIHFVREELRAFHDQEIETTDEYFSAEKRDDEKAEDTLELLFARAFNQLVDYSSIKLVPTIATSLSPIVCKSDGLQANAEYFYDNMMIALSQNDTFLAAERKDLQPVLEELKFQLDALSDEDKAAELGKFLGAELLVTSTLYEREKECEMILKLLKVETVEILSVTKVKIDKRLGL